MLGSTLTGMGWFLGDRMCPRKSELQIKEQSILSGLLKLISKFFFTELVTGISYLGELRNRHAKFLCYLYNGSQPLSVGDFHYYRRKLAGRQQFQQVVV